MSRSSPTSPRQKRQTSLSDYHLRLPRKMSLRTFSPQFLWEMCLSARTITTSRSYSANTVKSQRYGSDPSLLSRPNSREKPTAFSRIIKKEQTPKMPTSNSSKNNQLKKPALLTAQKSTSTPSECHSASTITSTMTLLHLLGIFLWISKRRS